MSALTRAFGAAALAPDQRARVLAMSRLLEAWCPDQAYAAFVRHPAGDLLQPVAGMRRLQHGQIRRTSGGSDQGLNEHLATCTPTPLDTAASRCPDTPVLARLKAAAPDTQWQLVRAALPDGGDALFAIAEPVGADALAVAVMLAGVLQHITGAPDDPPALPEASLLWRDPCPGLLFNGRGDLVLENPAASALASQLALPGVHSLLPANHGALFRSAVQGVRSIAEVETDVADRILLWTYIPVADGRRVALRGRDATEQRRAARWSSRVDRIHRLITENTTDLISRHDRAGTFLYVSPASLQLLGRMPGELEGTTLSNLMAPAEREQQDADAKAALVERGFHTMTCRLRDAQGGYRWFEIAMRAIRDTYSGEIAEWVCISRDVTKRHRAEEETRRLAAIVAATTDLVLFSDARGSVLHFNRAAGDHLGLQHPLDSTIAVADLVAGNSREAFIQEALPTALRGGVWRGDLRLAGRGPDGSFPVSMVVMSHTGDDDALQYVSVIARDMSDREMREAQAREHQDELAHAARLSTMGELASGIAHEMNQPLASIMNYARACRNHLDRADTPDRDHLQDGLKRIDDRAQHAAQVIQRLRAFIRKDRRQITAVAVEPAVRSVIEMVAWEARRSGVRIDWTPPPRLPPVVADQVLLEQVLVNLIRNAIDASRDQDGNHDPRIWIDASHDDEADTVTIHVRDNGPGLDAHAVENLFEPFRSSKPEGVGLGLTISRSIVEQLGGTLGGEADVAGGMVFNVTLAVWTRGGEA
ncbi:PAS domain-containing sensor histidine kinase [Aquisalimonas asiatica]|uniref:PAS domain-containing sensor histidine kinase n=1 Tax=Aquisalimonas asiatica TaxID=406100 RepID=UPI0011133B89|nr:PAS domain S-box protein [Aquisalimonas asiatica]